MSVMRLLPKLFSDRGKRARWEAGLTWFRLRYADPPTRVIKLLSRSEACGRVALYFQPGEAVSELYLGVPEIYARLLERMAADFGFSVWPKPQKVEIPLVQPMTAVTDLPWDRAFVAHITNEFAFVSLENEGGQGPYLPPAPAVEPGRGAATWTLPANPPPGLTLRPSWNPPQPPACPPETGQDAGHWPLGWTADGVPLSVCGQINLYGRQEAVADWLVQQVTHTIMVDSANLVVIDGAGDLAPRLKRKAAITRLLGSGLTYLDLDGPALSGGFNPLALVPGESRSAARQRWQDWLGGMNLHPQIRPLLAQAHQAGVGDIPGLRKWLKQASRQQGLFGPALSGLELALNRLTAEPDLGQWLEWPTIGFEALPAGTLIFACRATSWSRRQLLRSVLLAVRQLDGVRLVLHGFPWPRTDGPEPARIITSNGPLLAESTRLLVGCEPVAAAKLSAVFLDQDPLLTEILEILAPNQAVLVGKGDIRLVFWPEKGNSGNWLL